MQANEARHYEEFKAFDIGIKDTPLFCETTQPNTCPVEPIELRRAIFDSLHSLCHPGIKATTRMILTRYFWSDIKNDAQAWCKECLAILEGGKTYQTTTKRLVSSNAAIHKCPYGYSRSFGACRWKQQTEVFAYIDRFVDKVVGSSAIG